MLDRSDIQGLVLDAYARTPVSAAILIYFEDGRASDWLRRIVFAVSSARRGEAFDPIRLNLAFTARGLAALGLAEATLREFPREFRRGMAHRASSKVLRDSGEDAPESWRFNDSAENGVDAVILVYALDAPTLARKLVELRAECERFGLGCQPIETHLPRDRREHFGFRMGLSEPILRGQRRRGRARLAAGEVLLGHRNCDGERAWSVRAPRLGRSRAEALPLVDATHVDFGFNGSYLVVRQLEQRVVAFWELARRAARELGADGESSVRHAAALFIGCWPNGAPLALYPEAEPTPYEPARFGYAEPGGSGDGCPFGAHARRANGRDVLSARHRILRRGRLYGPKIEDAMHASDDGLERGLVFVALNANIARQFETIQGCHFNGPERPCGERDPLLGRDPSRDAFPLENGFTIPAEPVRHVVRAIPRLVRVRGGAYLFLPSLRALGYLADLRSSSAR